MVQMNRLHNSTNPNQGEQLKVLCVCSAGLLRSPVTAQLLAARWGFNTRAVGTSESHALIPLDLVHIYWADQIVAAEKGHKQHIEAIITYHARNHDDVWNKHKDRLEGKLIHVLDVPDIYQRDSIELYGQVRARLGEIYGPETTS